MNNVLKNVVGCDILRIINEYNSSLIKTNCNGCEKHKFYIICKICDEFKCDECDLLCNDICLNQSNE